MICYYYPPLTDVGVRRSVRFSTHFRENGWEPYVLSVKNPDREYCDISNDEPPSGIPVRYTYSLINLSRGIGKLNGFLTRLARLFGVELKGNFFSDMLCIPDGFWGWIPITTIESVRLVKCLGLEYIYATCSPFSSAVIGVLTKKITGIPLILDFRDPFALGSPAYLRRARLRRMIDRVIERHLLANADLFVVTTDETRQNYVEKYPEVSGKTIAIHNGIDKSTLCRSNPDKFDKFTIIYTGQFYLYADRLKQYTDLFFRALRSLRDDGKINSHNFQFLYYGDDLDQMCEIAHSYEVDDIVCLKERIPHRTVLREISRSHLLLLRILKPMMSTKLFEGIALDVPILATIPEGEARDLIEEYSQSSYVVGGDSSNKVAEAIEDAIGKYRDCSVIRNDVDRFLEEYSSENLARRLIGAIDSIGIPS